MKIKKLTESSLVDKKVNTLGKYGKPMYFTADQLKDAKAKYPEYDFEEITIDKSLPQGQKAYIINTQAEKTMNEASYGGAFDIADDQYFTRDDLNELSDEVLEIVQKSFDNKLDTSSSYIEDGNELEVTLADEDGVEFTSKIKIDMRKIKKPSDLSDRYKTVLADDLINQISEYRKEFMNESLENEDGWSEEIQTLLEPFLDDVDDLSYEVKNTVRGAKTGADTVDDLVGYFYQLKEYVEDIIEELEDNEEVLDENNNETKESFEGEYSDKFRALAKEWKYNEDDLLSLINEIIRYCPEEDLKDLWIHNRYNLENDLDENKVSLSEDLSEKETEGPEEGPEYGLSSIINTAIQDEWKTIQLYNDLVVNATSYGYEDIVSVIDDIRAEEIRHVGQLQKALETISPNLVELKDGEEEAKKQLNNPEGE
jgi:hypothetical protein